MARGPRLDNLRTQRGAMSVGDLAKKANVSDWTVRRLEAGGNCDAHEAQRIADALGVSLVTLGHKDL